MRPRAIVRGVLLVFVPMVIAYSIIRTRPISSAAGQIAAAGSLAAAVRLLPQDSVLVGISVLYIGSSTCQWCTRPETEAAIRTIVDTARVIAAQVDLPIELIGVDLDPERGAELKHLSQMAQFDQVAVGHSFMNAVAIEASWGRMPGPSGTPQVIVFTRRIRKLSARGERLSVSIGDPEVLVRKIGYRELLEWADGGAMIPELMQVSADAFQ
jgi:hypothetical protein